MAQCTAKAKSSGIQCRRHAVTGYRVCQVHGAGSPLQGRPGGIQKKTLQFGGRHSRFLPIRLAARYAESQQDPELLVLRDELSLTDARIEDLILRVDTGEAGRLWRELKETYSKLTTSMRKQNADDTADALRELGIIINKGLADYAAWGDVFQLVEQRRKLVESEQRRVVAAKYILRMDEAMLLMGALAASVRKYVSDTTVLAKINQEFIRLSERTGESGFTDESNPTTEFLA